MDEGRKLRVLLVDDDEEDYILTEEMLREIPQMDLAIDWASSYEEALGVIERREHDVYILDYRLGAHTGLELLGKAMELGVSSPLILLTGTGDRDVDVEAMKTGATAYLLKDKIDPQQLERTIRYSLQQKQSERQMRHLAHHDALTGLANRLLFNEHLGRAIAQAARSKQRLAVLFLDLDDFKEVNDTLGHAAGDQLLKRVAQRLNRCVRMTDSVARQAEEGSSPAMGRLGGDEFIVMLTNIDRVENVSIVAGRILGSITQPVSLLGQAVTVSASIGVALYPDDGEDSKTLVKNADTAMYHAKARSKNTICFYNASMAKIIRGQLDVERELREALAGEALSLTFDPVMTLDKSRVIALDALVRWEHPREGWLAAERVRSLAEQGGMVELLDWWALEAACMQARRWQREGLSPVPITVRLDRRSHTPGAMTTARGILEEAGLEAGLVRIAISGGVLGKERADKADLFRRLTELGSGLVIDDFGSSPLAIRTLVQLPVEMLLIDRDLVRGLDDEEHQVAVKAIVALAHAAGWKVAAKGLETDAQRVWLEASGCDGGQGPLLSPPLQVAEVTALLAR